jgi:hypothetical protein
MSYAPTTSRPTSSQSASGIGKGLYTRYSSSFIASKNKNFAKNPRGELNSESEEGAYGLQKVRSNTSAQVEEINHQVQKQIAIFDNFSRHQSSAASINSSNPPLNDNEEFENIEN